LDKKFDVAIVNAPYPSFEEEEGILGDIANVVPIRCRDVDELIRLAANADALMLADVANIPLKEEALKKLKKAKVLSFYGVGVDVVDLNAASRLKISVTNVPDYGVSEVADHTLALMLSMIRRVTIFDRALRTKRWEDIRSNVSQIRGNFGEIHRLSTFRLGLIGFGRIAREVSKRARAFGFEIEAYDPYVKDELFAQESVKKVSLDELLQNSDIISVHVVLTKETKHLINRATLSKMKRGVFIVNTSRGGVIDQEALEKALIERRVAGAALDVFELEPLPKDSPLLEMQNVVLTPHIAWYSEESMSYLRIRTSTNVKERLLGHVPPNQVNKME